MIPISLTPEQLWIVEQPLDVKCFLDGPAGAGKTSAAAHRLLTLLQNGVPGNSILLITPQRGLARPYRDTLNAASLPAGGQPVFLTIGGLAQRMVELFWPLAAEAAGFAYPDEPPVFLTMETAQYYMARLVRPLFDEGFFDTLIIDRNRIYSQILDNLNKAALVGFPHTQIAERLIAAWNGAPVQARIYQDAQECASRFREYCLAHNLLDFSLQIEVFLNYVWATPLCQNYLLSTYRHLLVDNLEEDPPITHDLLRQWLPTFQSALLVYDLEAGFRVFLGADPQTNAGLRELCSSARRFEQPLVMSPQISHALSAFQATIDNTPFQPTFLRLREAPDDYNSWLQPVESEAQRYYPQLLDGVAERIAALVLPERYSENAPSAYSVAGIPAREIAILAPYISDSLRFSLTSRLEALGVPVRSHRPSRSLRDEPAVQCMLTLASLAHPDWSAGSYPSRFDFTNALIQAIQGIDLVRAHLLTDIVYRKKDGVPFLSPFEQIKPQIQERITYQVGQRYDTLRLWLEEYRQAAPEELDVFLSRIFGELLSQPGFGFHLPAAGWQPAGVEITAGEVIANLIESVQKFRWAARAHLQAEGIPVGQEYLAMVRDGVIAAQYLRSWQDEAGNAILLSPAYTFLLSNRPVDIQFWLDIGSRGWYERLFQPLTQPYVLSRNWQEGKLWGDEDEFQNSQRVMRNLVPGLLRRCRRQVVLCFSDLGEQGYEQRGQLLYVSQRWLQALREEPVDAG